MTNKKKGILTGIYSAAVVMVLFGFGVAMLNTGNSPRQEAQHTADSPTPVNKTGNKSYKEITTTASTASTTEATTQPTTSAQPTTAEISATPAKTLSLYNEDEEMLWPVSGQILMDYNVTTAVFDKTLEQYRTNDSISIAAVEGENVYAAADGQVLSIEKDDVKGVTVTLDNGNGWRTTYSQLSDNLDVCDGQSVYKGDVIGRVTQPTKQSSALGTHLDFAVYKNEVAQDPKLTLAALE